MGGGHESALVVQADQADTACEAEAEQQAFDKASDCITANKCGAETCLATYTSQFPNGAHTNTAHTLVEQAKAICRLESREPIEKAWARVQTADKAALEEFRRNYGQESSFYDELAKKRIDELEGRVEPNQYVAP